MNIKIIPKEKDTKCHLLDKNRILMIQSLGSSGEQIPFSRVRYFLYHADTNVREELLPEVKKYDVCDFTFCDISHKDLYFFVLEYTKFPVVTFALFTYDLESSVCREIYRYEDNVKLYEQDKKVELFILNSNYFIMQTSLRVQNEAGDYRGYLSFETFLYDCQNRMKFEIMDKRITDGGIQQMIPVGRNVCAIRLGYNLIDDERFEHLNKNESAEEYIGLISISQFISDLILRIPAFSMEYIDEVFYDRTLSSMSKQGKYIIYSRINTSDLSQEIVFYEFVKKDSIIVVNKNRYNEEAVKPCVLGKKPYLIRTKRKMREFYCIKKNAITSRIPVAYYPQQLLNDYILFRKTKKSLFGKNEDYLELYSFDNMNRIHREKAVDTDCILYKNEDLYMIVEEN